MNKIVYSYASETEIPENLKDSYVLDKETNTYILDGFAPKEEIESYKRKAEHIKSDKERADEALRELLGDRKASDVKAILKKLDEERNKPVDKKQSDTVPLEEYIRIKEQLESLLPDFENLKSYKAETEQERKTRLIVDKLKEEAVKAKMNSDMINELWRYANDFTVDEKGNVYIDKGEYNIVTPEKWVEDLKGKMPSMFPAVIGGGMRGGSNGTVVQNPYLGTNRTEILAFKNKYGDEKAKQFAKEAGKDIYGTVLTKKKW